jgi:catechol 2,3-dioxygenase-like lactoylglutathione lyase family enzyme
MRLDGFGVMVDDMPTMVRFYRDVLGFEIKEDENTSNVFLEKDGTLFLLYRKSDFEKMTGRSFSYAKGINGHYEIALSVSNYAEVDKAFETIVQLGAQAVMPPTTEEWGQRTCYIADPEGNLIEIGSFTGE